MEKTSEFLSQSWDNLTFANNFLFCKILESDKELCRKLLELLLHIKIDHLEFPETERSMQPSINSKSVRFDVYTKGDNKIFDVEMQTTVNKSLAKRSRYYQSVIDMDNLSKGEQYSQLKDSYIIFLCLDDPFGKNLPSYYFENICREDNSVKLDDRAFKVFFNASRYDKMASDEEKSFFKFLRGEEATSEFTKSIEEKVSRAKENPRMRQNFITWEQAVAEEAEGRAKSIAEDMTKQAKLESARKLLAMHLGTHEQIAQAVGLSVQEVKELAGQDPSA